jgi:hypothetical protein
MSRRIKLYYGYSEDSKNWNESRKWILAEELEKALNIPIATRNKLYKNDGHSPYIEVEEPETYTFAGKSPTTISGTVSIRRITNLSEEEHDKLVEEADRIYGLVMNNLIRE